MKKLENWLKEKLLVKSKKIEPSSFASVKKQEQVTKNSPHQAKKEQQHSHPQSKAHKKFFKPYDKNKQYVQKEHKTKLFQKFSKQQEPDLKIIPLGGLEEVGRNMTVFETKNDIIIVDCGLQFPEQEMLGIDYVIPDTQYLEDKKHKIRGILITHGHYDHIGALKHVLPKIGNPPVYGSRLTIGFIQKILDEHAMTQGARLHAVDSKETLKLGSFVVEFIKITHNIPGAFSIIIRTPAGIIIHTGDFKMDFTAPFPSDIPDSKKLAAIGKEGVLALISDSTNATQEGYARSEIDVNENLDNVIKKAKGRIIIGSFASNIGRMQQIINSAVKYERKIFISGRSMVNNISIAKKLEYLNFPTKAVSKISKAVENYADDKILIITTGSQGEEFSALTRMANDTHAHIKIRHGDTIIFSSTPIPGTGNERAIYNNINKLIRKKAIVITNDDLDVHTSGHGKREDLRLMIQLIRPQYFIPFHGELFMRESHKKLALEEGISEHNIFLLTNGSILEFIKGQKPVVSKQHIEIRQVYVDGLGGTESEGKKVLEERKTMSEQGVVIVTYKVQQKNRTLLGQPKVISRGFIYEEELEKIHTSVVKEAHKIFVDITKSNATAKQRDIRWEIQKQLGRFIDKKIGREPLIIPLIIEM